MKVTIEEHTVHIEGDFTGPYIDLSLSPQDAYDLLLRLEEKRALLSDLALNYSDCRECGQVHHRSTTVCPTLDEEARMERIRVRWLEQPSLDHFGGYGFGAHGESEEAYG
jgi:hypothetical protein